MRPGEREREPLSCARTGGAMMPLVHFARDVRNLRVSIKTTKSQAFSRGAQFPQFACYRDVADSR